MNLVLISRNPEKLENVSKEITAQYPVEVKVIAVDFKSGLQIYDTISKGIQGLEIGVLVNNIGISYSHPEYFLEAVKQDEAFLTDIVSCNINSVTYMTKLILPSMVQRGKGLIINISSMAAVIPNPLLSVYSATKVKYLDFLKNQFFEVVSFPGICRQVHRRLKHRIQRPRHSYSKCSPRICMLKHVQDQTTIPFDSIG